MKVVIAFMLAFAFVMPAAAAGSHPCYGKREIALAKEMLANMPALRYKLTRDKREAVWLRNETCGTIAFTGRLFDIDYAERFYNDTGYRSIVVAAERKQLDPLRVQAALVDRLWPPKMT